MLYEWDAPSLHPRKGEMDTRRFKKTVTAHQGLRLRSFGGQDPSVKHRTRPHNNIRLKIFIGCWGRTRTTIWHLTPASLTSMRRNLSVWTSKKKRNMNKEWLIRKETISHFRLKRYILSSLLFLKQMNHFRDTYCTYLSIQYLHTSFICIYRILHVSAPKHSFFLLLVLTETYQWSGRKIQSILHLHLRIYLIYLTSFKISLNHRT